MVLVQSKAFCEAGSCDTALPDIDHSVVAAFGRYPTFAVFSVSQLRMLLWKSDVSFLRKAWCRQYQTEMQG
jgi:hypothetical protein